MKINANYLKPVNYNKAKETMNSKGSVSTNNVRKDTVVINSLSKQSVNNQNTSILDVKNNIVEGINKNTSIERLNGLKTDIQNNNYEISSKKIVGSLLD